MAVVDLVYELLKAVNETTLGRIEAKVDNAIQRIETLNLRCIDIERSLSDVNQITLGRIEAEIKDVRAQLP